MKVCIAKFLRRKDLNGIFFLLNIFEYNEDVFFSLSLARHNETTKACVKSQFFANERHLIEQKDSELQNH